MLKPLPDVDLRGLVNHDLRTEDVRFSPSGRRLAVVATNGSICLFAVDTRSRPIRINRHAELNSTSLSNPHGIDFLSEDIVAVANRSAWVTFYRIPDVNEWQDRLVVEPIHEMESRWFGRKGETRMIKGRSLLCGPGSVRANDRQVFVACNNACTVTAHPYQVRQGTIETGDGTIVAEGCGIPDGIALSRDGRWIAVSDHHNHQIVVYCADDLSRSCELRDVDLHFPHGLCFDPSGRALYVSDAGERDVHVFVATGDDWRESADGSAFKLPAVEIDVFHKTRDSIAEEMHKALEGGIKGIDIDPSGRIVVTTCRHQILRFFETERVEGLLAAERVRVG